MSVEETCGTCKYYHRNVQNMNEGFCRRFPAQVCCVTVGTQVATNTFFPSMLSAGWCGEYKRKVLLDEPLGNA